MTSVEILAMNQIVVDKLFNWDVAALTFAIVLCIFMLIGVVMSVVFRDWNEMSVGIIAGIALGVFASLVGGHAEGIPTEYETRYKVIISDEVSMNDFLERYEILDQEGKIYTVRERDGVEGDN